MTGNSGLPTDLNAIANFCTTCNTHMSNDYAHPAYLDVVPDLYEIIDPRPCANNGIRCRPPIDSAVGTDFHAVTEGNYSALPT